MLRSHPVAPAGARRWALREAGTIRAGAAEPVGKR